MAANTGDYIQLTLPTRLSADQRQRMIASHNRLLGILNGPASKDAKAAARKSIKELHKQISLLGGRVDINSSNYQTDPTTGEITGIVGNVPEGKPQPAKSVMSATAHQVRVPLMLTKPTPKTVPATVAGPAPTGIMAPLTREQALSGTAGPTTADLEAAAKAAPARGRLGSTAAGEVPPAVIVNPQLMNEPVPSQVSTELKPIGVQAAAAIPPAPAAPATAPSMSAPTVPPLSEDLNADPLLGALPPASPPPAAAAAEPAESPEMTELRRLVAQPSPQPPGAQGNLYQAAAYGLLAGLKGAGAVEPLISGQRAAAAQSYALAQQDRETRINNLLKLVTLQDEEAQRKAVLGQKQQDLVTAAQKTTAEMNGVHQAAAPVIGGALAWLQTADKSVDPSVQARAQTILSQIQELSNVGQALQRVHDQNPLAISPEQVAFYRSRVDQLTGTVDKAIGEDAKRIEQTKLPEAIQTQIAALNTAQVGARQALAMITEGIGGPIESRFYNLPFVSIVSPARAEQIGVLDSILQRISAEAARGSTGRLAEFETEVFPAIFLNSTLPVGTLTGRLKGLAAWSDAKAKVLQGVPGAQNDAERSLAEAAGWVVVAHTGEGYPVWQSPQGLRYTEMPEAAGAH